MYAPLSLFKCFLLNSKAENARYDQILKSNPPSETRSFNEIDFEFFLKIVEILRCDLESLENQLNSPPNSKENIPKICLIKLLWPF